MLCAFDCCMAWRLLFSSLRSAQRRISLIVRAFREQFSQRTLCHILFNLVGGCGITVAANLISAKSIPLGYLYPLVQVSLFGIFLGTNSFAISQGGRLFPSLTLVTGAGFYELTAYILVAAATAKLTLWNQTGLLGGSLERIKKTHKIKLARSELSVLAFGVLLLLAAAVIEASSIMGA